MKQELRLSQLNDNRWSIISEGAVSIDLDSPTIEEINEKFQNIIDIFLVFEIDGVVYVCKFLI
jgi:hypothetical protein